MTTYRRELKRVKFDRGYRVSRKALTCMKRVAKKRDRAEGIRAAWVRA